MDKAQVEDRIKKLEAEREQLKATFAAYEGALQEAKYWLDQLNKPVEEEKKED